MKTQDTFIKTEFDDAAYNRLSAESYELLKEYDCGESEQQWSDYFH